MIRLIAADLDGTLLDAEKRLPTDFFTVFEELRRRGVLFLAASGRSYVTIRRSFSPLEEQVSAICDNGAFVRLEGEEPQVSPIPRGLLRKVAAAGGGLEDAALLFCGRMGTYHLPIPLHLKEEVERYYINCRETPAPHEAPDEIFKVAVCDGKGSRDNSGPCLREALGGSLEVQVSGPMWCDVMNPGVSKGAALARIQRRFSILPQETMAFGDYYNDITMLQRAAHSYVMKNAPADMRPRGRFLAPGNHQRGVMRVIRRQVLGWPEEEFAGEGRSPV